MSNLSEDSAERARKYIATFETEFQRATTANEDLIVKTAGIKRVHYTIQRYLQDARYYIENGKPTTSLASVAYAEGLLDALLILDLAESKPME